MDKVQVTNNSPSTFFSYCTPVLGPGVLKQKQYYAGVEWVEWIFYLPNLMQEWVEWIFYLPNLIQEWVEWIFYVPNLIQEWVEWIFYLPGLLAIATNIIFFINIFRWELTLTGVGLKTFFIDMPKTNHSVPEIKKMSFYRRE